MVFGLHARPVRSEVAAPEFRKTLFFSRAMPLIASATEEVGTSTIASTPWSYHWRAMLAPTSGLFWWSACEHLDGEAAIRRISAAACWVQAALPGPVGSR